MNDVLITNPELIHWIDGSETLYLEKALDFILNLPVVPTTSKDIRRFMREWCLLLKQATDNYDESLIPAYRRFMNMLKSGDFLFGRGQFAFLDGEEPDTEWILNIQKSCRICATEVNSENAQIQALHTPTPSASSSTIRSSRSNPSSNVWTEVRPREKRRQPLISPPPLPDSLQTHTQREREQVVRPNPSLPHHSQNTNPPPTKLCI